MSKEYNGKQYSDSDFVNGLLIVDGVLVGVNNEAVKNGTIVVPEGVKIINALAFKDCKFDTVKFPDSLESVGKMAFFVCSQLKQVQFGKGLKSIGRDAFSESGLQTVKLPDSLESIEEYAFYKCKDLHQVEFGKNLKILGEESFKYSGVRKIKLPDSLEVVGKKAFEYCHELEHAQLGKNVKEIEEGAFGSSGITEIEFPKSLKTIKEGAFEHCNALMNMDFNEGLETIGSNAFYMCGLKRVSLPKSLKTTGDNCFDRVVVGEVIFTDEKQFYMVSYLPTIETVTLVGDIKKVDEEQLFEFTGNINHLVLGDNIEELGKTNGDLGYVRDITFPSTIKSIWSSNFSHAHKQDVTVTDCLVLDSINEFSEYVNVKITENTKFLFADATPEATDFINNWDFAKRKKFFDWLLKQKHYNPKFDDNCAKNIQKVFSRLENKKIKFLPSIFMMSELPADKFDNFFANGNDVRWGKIVKLAGLDVDPESYKSVNIPDAFRLYYALGGFSEDEAVSNRAYKFMTTELIPSLEGGVSSVGSSIHRIFGGIKTDGDYNPMFAGFVMKYYNGDPNFLSEDGISYFAEAHNSFKKLQEAYPYRGITGNEKRSLFTPEFIIKHCKSLSYVDVEKGNEVLADMVAKYGFDQQAFNEMQKVYNYAKQHKDTYVIKANKDDSNNPVRYNFLKKDDPSGFVIGKLTNCCQHYGGAGASCVDDGYLNSNAGFLVFEELKRDENGDPIIKYDIDDNPILDGDGNPVYETRILGQAYIWYDASSKTVCYDNIEVPTAVLDELRSNEESSKSLTFKDLLNAVERSANAVMNTMNADGTVRVKKVTTGEGYNDLVSAFKNYKRETANIPSHREQLYINVNGDVAPKYDGYTDADDAQYVIADYMEHTDKLANDIQDNIDEASIICSNTLARTSNITHN